MARTTLYRSAEYGGHYPDCVPGLICHCPLPSEEAASRPARAIRSTPVRQIRVVPLKGPL